ncbi:MAG: hypothetical protein ACOZB3_09755 [Calditrichota bacterium]
MVHRITILILIAIISLAPAAWAGGSIFSANGVGEQSTTGGARAAGLGGGGYGLADSISFNSSNPALAAFLKRTSVRMCGQIGFWHTTGVNNSDADAEFSWKDFRLYFPITNRWKLGFGAEPTQQTDLNTFAQRTAIFGDTSTVHYEQRDVWVGSTVELRIDNALQLSEKAALGIGAVYIIHRSSWTHTLDFDAISGTSHYIDAAYRNTETFRGWTADLGAFLQVTPKLGIGAVYRPRISGDWTYEVEKSNSDSLVKSEHRSNAPGFVKLGISYNLKSRLIGVVDVQYGQWASNDKVEQADLGRGGEPINPLFVSCGLERTAGRSAVQTGFYNWGIRGGLFYRQHYWSKVNNTAVEDLGVTFGLSMPLTGSQAFLHWANEFGMRGMDEQKLGAKETYFRTSLQIELTEKWFERSRRRIPR